MPRGSDPAPPRTETPDGLRAMAAHARRLASTTLDELTASKLIEFAEELEARATALECPPQIVSHDEAAAVQQAENGTDQEAP